jgi:hypothetical protein
MRPGHEREFPEAFQEFSRPYEKTESDLPWVVYEVNAGMPSPTFLAFKPMRTLAQNDDLVKRVGATPGSGRRGHGPHTTVRA